MITIKYIFGPKKLRGYSISAKIFLFECSKPTDNLFSVERKTNSNVWLDIVQVRWRGMKILSSLFLSFSSKQESAS